MAWLAAVPKPPPGSQRAKLRDEERLSRIEELRKNRIPPPMPPNPAPHIVNRLIEMGLTEAAGMGVAPLSWREIDAWCARTGVDLDPWEARLIRRLSAEYLAEGRRAESETCPPPWRGEVTPQEMNAEVVGLRAVLSGL